MSDSVNVRAMRNFRLKHGLSLRDVANPVGKSVQWLSYLELGRSPASIINRYYSMLAFQLMLFDQQRKLAKMEEEYKLVKHKLMEEEPEWKEP